MAKPEPRCRIRLYHSYPSPNPLPRAFSLIMPSQQQNHLNYTRSAPLSYRQMAGRAGRKGEGRARGEAFLVAANKGQARRAAGLMNAGLAAVKRREGATQSDSRLNREYVEYYFLPCCCCCYCSSCVFRCGTIQTPHSPCAIRGMFSISVAGCDVRPRV